MIRRSIVMIVAMLAFLPLAGSAVKAFQDPKTNPPGQAAADVVVVKVLGVSITEKQVLATINQIARSQQATQQQIQTKDITFYKDALDTLIGALLLKNEAKEKGLIADQAKVEEAMKSVKGQFPTEAQYQQALQQQNLKEVDVRQSITDNLLYQQVLDPVVKAIAEPTDAEIQKFYDENPKYFDEPEQVHAAHIFLKVDATAPPEQKAELRKKLEAIRADIESKKTTFAEAAKISDDKSNAQNGGDLGFFKRGDIVPALETAAFAAKPGTLTPVIETEYGYHLVNVIEFKAGGKAPVEKAKPDIKAFLERQKKQDATRKYLEGLKGKAKIEVVMSDEEWNKRHAVAK
jgi:peptidyl-prolyl cis-trans isomerase C